MTKVLSRACAGLLALGALVLISASACSGDDIAGGGGSPPCRSCYEVYVNGGIACGPGASSDAWHNLANTCACGQGACADACKASFCNAEPADMGCSTCLAQSCLSAEMTCANN